MLHGICVCVCGGGGGGGEYTEKEGEKECGSRASVTVGGRGKWWWGDCCQLFFCNLAEEREGVCVCKRERDGQDRVCEGEK